MIAHGALKSNAGRQTLRGADRHHQRQKEARVPSLETARERMDKKAGAVKGPQDKVAESASKGHGKRLEPRRRRLPTLAQELKAANAQHASCAEPASALGPGGQRAERDWRTQTILTIRTLFLEHMLRACMAAWWVVRQTKARLQQVLERLFERSGSRMEPPSQVLYRVNTAGVSLANRRLLSEIVEGLCTMGLQERGKPMHVRLKDRPP